MYLRKICLIFIMTLVTWLAACNAGGDRDVGANTDPPTLSSIFAPPTETARPTITVENTPLPPTTEAAPLSLIVVATGTVELELDLTAPSMRESLDLDTGETTADQDLADFVIAATRNESVMFEFAPINGTMVAPLGLDEPGAEGCFAAADSFSRDRITEFFSGIYLCLQTEQGVMTQLHVDEINVIDENAAAVVLSFKSWKKSE